MRDSRFCLALHNIKTFRQDRRGSILPLFAILAVVLIMVIGASLDYGRAITMRASINRALDTAVLVAAKKLAASITTEAAIIKLIEDNFDANMKSNGIEGVNIKVDANSLDLDLKNGRIGVDASASIPTYFLSAGGLGPETINVGVSVESSFPTYDVEVALVVDVTGSMRQHVSSLKEAAASLINILIPEGTKESEAKVAISIVPYSQGVNAQSYAREVTDNASSRCVTEREGAQQYTDAVYDYDKEDSEFFGGGSTGCSSRSELKPLSKSRDSLLAATEKFTASGGTAGQTGIAWGWYTISPRWTSVFTSGEKAGSYTDDKLLKFAIIMTDGDFNQYYEKSKNWRGQEVWSQRSGYGYNGQPSKRARALCDAMKEKDIEIYSIYFGSNNSSTGAKVMKDCASTSDTYFNASSGSALIAAFQHIANEIQTIFLSD